jgi:tyrosinase
MSNPQLSLTRYDIWDLNNGNIPAFPVTNPPGWDDVSLYYAKALKEMGWQASPDGNTDVTSMWPYSDAPNTYFFQAAMHWWPQYQGTPPAPYDQRWSHCTHGPASAEQYFLAWHRAFIYFFEVIVRSHVADLGGPANWALPYWNYSYYDNSDPSAPGAPWVRSNLPWVFTQTQLPDGTPNPLYIGDTDKRGLQPVWPGSAETMFLETVTPYYDQAYGFADFQDFNQTLDGQPHGAVHVDTGSGDQQVTQAGWMTSTVTASFDPIFWLHHSEIDRFWAGWNAAGNATPTDPTWLAAQDDPLLTTRWNFWADGNLANTIVVHPGQMVDPANLAAPFPYSYGYQNLPTVPAPTTSGAAQAAAQAAPAAQSGAQAAPAAQSGAQTAPAARSGAQTAPAARSGAQASSGVAARPLVAGRVLQASAAPAGGSAAELGPQPVTVPVPVVAQVQAAATQLAESPSGAESPRVILRLEGITADGPPGNYEIYLNYPQADRGTAGSVPHYVGLLAGFGADHHHDHGDGGDDQHGLSASYDITAVVAYLRTHGGWDEAQASVTFVPAARPRAGFQLMTSGLRIASITIETR